MRAPLAALLLAAGSAIAAPAEPEVRMMRISDATTGSVSVVRVSGETSRGPVTVLVAAGARSRLFLRRAGTDGGATVYEAWLDSRPGVTVTRDGPGPLLLEAGGYSLRIHEADLGLRTVRCWVGAFASRMEPRLLTAAADVRVVREWAGMGALADELLPVRILWSVGEEPGISPRGDAKVEEGPFTGAPWDDLLRAATEELGRP